MCRNTRVVYGCFGLWKLKAAITLRHEMCPRAGFLNAIPVEESEKRLRPNVFVFKTKILSLIIRIISQNLFEIVYDTGFASLENRFVGGKRAMGGLHILTPLPPCCPIDKRRIFFNTIFRNLRRDTLWSRSNFQPLRFTHCSALNTDGKKVFECIESTNDQCEKK